MKYIDFDGVIVDTDDLLFEEWRKKENHESLSEEVKIEYIKRRDWEYIITHSEVINNAIYYLHESDPEKTAICTKIHSMKNEGRAKINWKIRNNIKQPLILVPYYCKKTDIVNAKGNILYDDNLQNLEDWEECGGYPILFDINDDGYDSWGQPNKNNYQKVLTLKDITKTRI